VTTLTTDRPLVLPDDVHNQTLVRNVHPPAWTNPTPTGRYNLVVLGAGTAGLVSAVGAASLGAKVAIVERHLMGGDCLNYGCVPSKALIRAGRAAAAARGTDEFGVHVRGPVAIDFAEVMTRLRRLRADISRHDAVARLSGLGIDVFLGQARFVAPDAVDVDGRAVRFSRAVVAVGARAATPAIPGLADAGYLTNETVFSLTTLPARLVVIGAGPIGCELAQAFRRLGSDVTLIGDAPRVLPRDDPDAAAVVQAALEREGIRLMVGTTVARVERPAGSVEARVIVERGGREAVVAGDTLLVVAGRTANVEGLGLERAGIAFDRTGLTVDDHLRTTNRRVFAAGDIASRFKFTHAADAMARVALQNALFFGRKKASALVIPWATYTDPEVAHVGLPAADAGRRGDVRTLTVALADVDRAVLDGAPEGFARVHADARGRILGATIVAPHAGEMIGEVSLAMTAGLTLPALARTIHPYPTHSESLKKLGDAWNRTRLTPSVRSLFETILRWRR
jgi:pyruvate/2-oxoglutarate dehydrogenase complex dihydrolipoamide dehydrogenase (E3) component